RWNRNSGVLGSGEKEWSPRRTSQSCPRSGRSSHNGRGGSIAMSLNHEPSGLARRLQLVLAGTLLATSAFAPAIGGAQESEKKVAVAGPQQQPEKKLSVSPAFWEAKDPINVTLTTNIGKLRGDKKEDPPW